MKAVILAAGMGRRLTAMDWHQPKCLLPCPQGTLLDNAITSALAHGIQDLILVVGFRKELVIQTASRHDAKFTFVVNERFESTNTLHSLRRSEKHLRDGFLLFNGDVWFREAVLDRLLAHHGSALAVEPKSCADEEVKVMVGDQDRVSRIGKSLSPEVCLGEYVGLAKFDPEFGGHFASSLLALDESTGCGDLLYEAALEPLLDDHPLQAVRIPPRTAIEIDTPDDYANAKRMWQT